ncbi:hypothetical protein TSUD_312800 [Trifolium subterraneum]|uniref:Retrotransposon gag domain-containing protein n=1 Tax=Trifolium subterraneum TaxID=3900 RepID=A0A2Z6NTV4_TRISU|nr:hypothetical protein TSUD_312800 [Trifolium subterraneum]
MASLGWGAGGEAWVWRRPLRGWEEEMLGECQTLLLNISLQYVSNSTHYEIIVYRFSGSPVYAGIKKDFQFHGLSTFGGELLGTVINPLIQNTNDSYQMLTNQMSRMADFFGAPPIQQQPIRPIQVQALVQETQMPNNPGVPENLGQQRPVAQVEPPVQNIVEPNPGVVLVNRNQNADEVVRNVQQNRFEGQNNLAHLVETILAQNGLNIGLHRPNFVSALSEYVLQTELPRNWKTPKFTKFAGDTSESTVEHIARYMVEAGNIADNENLRMKYFPNSLTKNAFTWFTTLPPHSIHTWTQLERLFHEQFYMGQTKISLKELASVKRKIPESIDDYLNRFRLLKARCFTQVPEHELVEMAAGGLDYSIRKKLDTQHLRDMAQLADRVRQKCKLNNSEVELCPRCSAVFDKKATEGLDKYMPYSKRQNNWPKQRPIQNKGEMSRIPAHQRLGYKTTFVPSNKAPVNQWVHNHQRFSKKSFTEKGSSSNTGSGNSGDPKKFAYKSNYMGKNPMTRTQ